MKAFSIAVAAVLLGTSGASASTLRVAEFDASLSSAANAVAGLYNSLVVTQDGVTFTFSEEANADLSLQAGVSVLGANVEGLVAGSLLGLGGPTSFRLSADADVELTRIGVGTSVVLTGILGSSDVTLSITDDSAAPSSTISSGTSLLYDAGDLDTALFGAAAIDLLGAPVRLEQGIEYLLTIDFDGATGAVVLTGLEFSAVPLPPAFLLLAGGLGAAALVGRRRPAA